MFRNNRLALVGLIDSLLVCLIVTVLVCPDEKSMAAHAARAAGWSSELQEMVRAGFKPDMHAPDGPPLVVHNPRLVRVSWFAHTVGPQIESVSVPRSTAVAVLRYREDDGSVRYYVLVDGESSDRFGWHQFFVGVTTENPWDASPQFTSI